MCAAWTVCRNRYYIIWSRSLSHIIRPTLLLMEPCCSIITRYALTTVRKEFNKFGTFIKRASYELKNVSSIIWTQTIPMIYVVLLLLLYTCERAHALYSPGRKSQKHFKCIWKSSRKLFKSSAARTECAEHHVAHAGSGAYI